MLGQDYQQVSMQKWFILDMMEWSMILPNIQKLYLIREIGLLQIIYIKILILKLLIRIKHIW
jgi:hypothetical protein